MRILEIVLLIFSICLWLKKIWNKTLPKKKTYWIIVFLITVILLLHFILERARWQMSFIYISLAIFLVLERSRVYKNVLISSASLVQSIILTLLLGVFSFISTVLSIAFPVFKLAEPTGQYSVGTSNYVWTDQSRKVSNGENRTVNVQVWYPAETKASVQKVKYISNLSDYSKAIQNTYGIPKQLLSYLNLIDSHAFSNAPFSEKIEKAPVIFFSHGNMLGQRFTNTFQVVELASHGYIVVAVEHPETALISAYSDSDAVAFKFNAPELPMTYETINKSYMPAIESQTIDIEFVLKKIQELDKRNNEIPIAGRMDFEKLGIMGHSLGGATAVNVMYKNNAFKAAIDMDGYLYGEERKEVLDRPLLIMTGKLKNPEIEDSPDIAYTEQERRKVVIGSYGVSINIKGAGHLSFNDIPLYSPLIEMISPNGSRNHKIINELSLVFFNKYFKGDMKNFSYLFEVYPEISLEKN